jgi:hypothetical protein
MISSKYTCANFPRWPSNTRVMSFWNVAGAFFSPNGITRYWYVAPSGVANAVRCFDALSIGICQYPDFKSMAENTVADPNSRSASLIFGNGAASSSVYQNRPIWMNQRRLGQLLFQWVLFFCVKENLFRKPIIITNITTYYFYFFEGIVIGKSLSLKSRIQKSAHSENVIFFNVYNSFAYLVE